MQLVSDLQRRPRKGRLRVEKRIVMFYDLCHVVRFITFLVHTVQTTIGARRTFVNEFFTQSDFRLSEALEYKTQDCMYNSTRAIYAFTGVETSFTAANINDVFVDHAIQMRLAIFIMVTAIVVSTVNNACVEANIYVIKARNFYIWKDILSATDLLLLAYVFVIASCAQSPRGLLVDYLKHCGVLSQVYLPFVPVISLYVFGSVGYFSYAVGMCLYLWNSLPKYGIMTNEEIAEYREWLRVRRLEKEQSRQFIEQAKEAQARMLLMRTAEFPAGTGGAKAPPAALASAATSLTRPPLSMMPMAGTMTPEQQMAMASGAYPYPYPYPFPPPNSYPATDGFQPTMPTSNLPAPQTFGMQPGLSSLPPSGMRGFAPPMSVPAGPAATVNMPRRRSIPAQMQRPHQQQP